MNKAELLKRRATLQDESNVLLAAINAGTLTEEQAARSGEINTELETIKTKIANLEAAEAQIRANAQNTRQPAQTHNNAQDRPWGSLGEQFSAVYSHAQNRQTDPRLYSHAAAGSNETVDSEGGFLVAPQFASDLLQATFNASQVASRCRTIPLTGNTITLPAVDETSRANGSRFGGLRVYRLSEAGSITDSKAKFKSISVKAEKIAGLTYVTDELLEDVPALDAWIRSSFPQEMAFSLDDEVVNGSGVGQCQGVFTAAALVSVAKKASQTADTIVADNIVSMYSRMPISSRGNAVWLIHPDAEHQLPLMTIGQQPVYLAAGSLANGGQYATLLGRPVIPCEQCQTLGDKGDILFVDLNQYLLATKGGIKADTSMHVKFTTDEMAYRFTWRVNGLPLWTSYVSPFKGSSNISPYVTLDARA